jgi:hypothetical protein
VGNKITNLIDNPPAALHTLNELAAALNNDASFGSAVTTSLANRYTKTETDNLLSTELNTTATIPMSQVTNLETTLINTVTDMLDNIETSDQIPISQITNLQTTLNAKAPVNNATFTGTVNGIQAYMVDAVDPKTGLNTSTGRYQQ